MPSTRDNRQFFEETMQSRRDTLLDDCVDWIQWNLKPDDVFSKGQLKSWAKDNGYVKNNGKQEII